MVYAMVIISQKSVAVNLSAEFYCTDQHSKLIAAGDNEMYSISENGALKIIYPLRNTQTTYKTNTYAYKKSLYEVETLCYNI